MSEIVNLYIIDVNYPKPRGHRQATVSRITVYGKEDHRDWLKTSE